MNNKRKNTDTAKASPSGNSSSAYIGRRISSKFDGQIFHGKIDVYNSRRHLWHVIYDDGDEEELDHGEILLAMELFDGSVTDASYIGRRVSRNFEEKVYHGTVDKLDENDRLWHVTFDDGDEEELDHGELLFAVDLFASINNDNTNKNGLKIIDPPQSKGTGKKPSPTKNNHKTTPFIIPIIVAVIASAIWLCKQMLVANASKQGELMLRSTGLLKFQPDKFQGANKKERYFEGWYYKFVTPLNNHTDAVNIDDSAKDDESAVMGLAVVPGIFYGNTSNSNESHAFIFVTVNGEKQHYYRFHTSEFSYASSKEEYYIQVAENRFTHSRVSLNLHPRQDDDARLVLQGELTFANPSPWPVSLTQLGAMGPVGWMPFLECTHGVLSFDHVLRGSLTMTPSSTGGSSGGVSSSVVSFDNGRGYTEKDYGRSFPSLWVWLQTNSFRNNPGTSLFVSIARVPVLGLGLPGFTAAIWHNSTLIPFATWSGAKFEDIRVSKDELYIAMRSSRRNNVGYRVEITVDRRNVPEVLLYAPVNFTKMTPFVWEALQAKVHVRLFNGRGDVILDDVGEYAGLEVHGNVDWLVENVCGKKTANKFICL